MTHLLIIRQHPNWIVKTPDKEALGAPTATKAEVKTEPENWEDGQTSKH